MTIKEKALRWWAQNSQNDKYVIPSNEFGDRRQREFLLKEQFLCPVAKGYWILKKPEDDIKEVFPLLYWEVVESILAKYKWSIRGLSALKILNGEQGIQKQLLVNTKQKTNWKVALIENCTISLSFDSDFDERLIRKVEVAGRELPVDTPERVLIDVSRLKPNDEIKSFIAGTQFDLRTLEVLYAQNPKPVVFKRLVGLAKVNDRYDLVAGLERAIKTYTHYSVGKKEKAGSEAAKSKAAVLNPPWVIRQEQQIQQFEEILKKKLARDIERLEKYPIKKLLNQANEHKKYDTYHSTTLEGYKITPEEVESLLSGNISKNKEPQGESVEKIKNRMAIVGYSKAFDFIIKNAETDFLKAYLSEKLIQDTYHHLFKLSADANIIDYYALVNYRSIPAFIRGSAYVPPSYEKLPELMASYESVINNIKNPIIKSILAHYLFVTVHPYIDGNGRTARLLMNYLLLASGYSWITIRADQRIQYFEALKTANLDNDILPFGKFIVGILKGVG